jgi:hypothetical protein
VDISPEAQNTQDTTHRPNEAQEEGRPKYGYFKPFLEGGTKYPWEEIQRQSMAQRLKKRPSGDCPTWGFMSYTVTKPRHYCGCQKVHADRSLIWLSPEKPCQSLTNTEVDAHSQPMD